MHFGRSTDRTHDVIHGFQLLHPIQVFAKPEQIPNKKQNESQSLQLARAFPAYFHVFDLRNHIGIVLLWNAGTQHDWHL